VSLKFLRQAVKKGPFFDFRISPNALASFQLTYTWPSIKDVRAQKGLSSADIMRTRRVLQIRTSALFDAKNFQFFRNLWCDRTDKEWLASADILRTRSRGQFFAILCRRLLWASPNNKSYYTNDMYRTIGSCLIKMQWLHLHESCEVSKITKEEVKLKRHKLI